MKPNLCVKDYTFLIRKELVKMEDLHTITTPNSRECFDKIYKALGELERLD